VTSGGSAETEVKHEGVRLVERISPQYLLSVRYISRDLFVYGDLASTFTSVRGGAFEVSGFLALPI
jgi:hypothetical protein